MEQGQANVGQIFCPHVLPFKKLSLSEREVKKEIQRGGNVDTELVHYENMALELAEHLNRELVFE